MRLTDRVMSDLERWYGRASGTQRPEVARKFSVQLHARVRQLRVERV